jgi:hypothetical protein
VPRDEYGVERSPIAVDAVGGNSQKCDGGEFFFPKAIQILELALDQPRRHLFQRVILTVVIEKPHNMTMGARGKPNEVLVGPVLER